MENNYIEHIEKFWPNKSNFILDFDFPIIFKILSSGKLKNDTIWQIMHDWMNVDTGSRLTYFKQLFKKCFKFDCISWQFFENNIFQSNIFKLLPLNFQKDLKGFAKEVVQPSFKEQPKSVNVAVVNKIPLLPEKEDEPLQQKPVVESISSSETVAHFATKSAKQLLVCITSNGGSTKYYNNQLHNWHPSAVTVQLPNGGKYFQLSLYGSILYAFGSSVNSKPTNKMWSRDLSDPSSQWTARADMSQKKVVFSSVVLKDTIYALGGRANDYNPLRSCERYCSQLNQWSTVADMNSARYYASAAVINGCIYVAGGKNDAGVLKSVERYDSETDTWREVAPMTTARWRFALTPFEGRLWAIGGSDNADYQPSSRCESYDPVTDTWREEAPLNEGRWGHAAIELNGELYVVGGFRNQDVKVVEKYVPTTGWVEDSSTNVLIDNPHLFLIPHPFWSYFTVSS